MLLDRLDEPHNTPLIEMLGVRLLAGQNGFGGWGYHCPAPSADELKRLHKLLKEDIKHAPEKGQGLKADQEEPAPRVLSKEIAKRLAELKVRPFQDGGMGDNGNTNMALMAVWSLRRHGFAIDWVTARADARFSRSQQQGGWGYLPLIPEGDAGALVNQQQGGWGYRAFDPKGDSKATTDASYHVWLNWARSRLAKGGFDMRSPTALQEIVQAVVGGHKHPCIIAFVYRKKKERFLLPSAWWNNYNPMGPTLPGILGTPLENFKLPYQANWHNQLWMIWTTDVSIKAIPFTQMPLQQLENGGKPAGFPILVPSQAQTGKLEPNLTTTAATPQMTASVLSSLALSQALRKDPNFVPAPQQVILDQQRDFALAHGLAQLAKTVGSPAEDADKVPTLPQRSNGFFTLWSLQRTCTAFGLEQIGGKDWHAWGSQLLLKSQQADGSFRGAFAQGGADTCFALLFLTKTDLTPDLTRMLKGEADSLRKLGEQPPPPAGLSPEEQELKRLTRLLVKGAPAQQDVLLGQLRDSAAPLASGVLVAAIPDLSPPQQNKARLCLLKRALDLPPEGVRSWLEQEDAEWRRAGALACAYQKQAAHVPALLPLLEDEEPPVALAARQALVSLTGQDFGPAANATEAERTKAVAAWKAWWKKKSGANK